MEYPKMIEIMTPVEKQCLVERLRNRATIRRHNTNRQSVRDWKSDRIADLLEDAAEAVETLWCSYKHKKD